MNIKLLDDKQLKDFSPGAGIQSFDDHLYLVGNGPKHVLVMNRSWKGQETINLFASDTFRGTKEIVSNVSATTIIQSDEIPFILMLGSGSTEPGSNTAVLMNLHTRAIQELDLTIFYDRLKQSGLEELNIIAVTVLDDKIIICNGATKTNTDTNIIITSLNFWKDQHLADILIAKIELEGKAGRLLILSDLTYSYENDWFISSILSEATNKTGDEGISRESYIGVVEDASRKIGRHRFKINKYFNLTQEDKKFKGQQVQSLCIQADKKEQLKLHLLSKNNKGENFLFKLRLKE